MAIFVVHMTVWKTFFYFVLHPAEKAPMVVSRCTFLSGWTYDIKSAILDIHY